MTKVVINKCYGGFSLSPLAVKRLAELDGRECYFFTIQREPTYDFDKKVPITLEQAQESGLFFSAFDIPNPDEVIGKAFRDEDGLYKTYNALYEKHGLTNRPDDRADPKLVQVVEELGEKADGQCAELAIVEIPDGVEWEVDEYDGLEHIAEKHQTWY